MQSTFSTKRCTKREKNKTHPIIVLWGDIILQEKTKKNVENWLL